MLLVGLLLELTLFLDMFQRLFNFPVGCVMLLSRQIVKDLKNFVVGKTKSLQSRHRCLVETTELGSWCLNNRYRCFCWLLLDRSYRYDWRCIKFAVLFTLGQDNLCISLNFLLFKSFCRFDCFPQMHQSHFYLHLLLHESNQLETGPTRISKHLECLDTFHADGLNLYLHL